MIQRDGASQELLQQGRQVLEDLSLDALNEAEQTIARFLVIWFLVEHIPLVESSEQRQVMLADAEQRYRNFQINHPSSPLVANAQWLIEMLRFDDSAPSNTAQVDESSAAINNEMMKRF